MAVLAQMLEWVPFVPPQVTDVTVFLAFASLSALIFSMAKAGFGSGLGLLAVPLMVIATDNADLATGIMLPLLIVADYVAVGTWWRRWDGMSVLKTVPGVLLGVGIGWAGIVLSARYGGEAIADALLKLLIGLIALAFVVLQVLSHMRGRPLTLRPGLAAATLAGGTAAFTSTLAHAGGPVAAMYFLPQQMAKSRFVATTAFFFFLTNQIKLPVYWSLGRINADTLGAGILLLPPIVAGAVLGRYLHQKLGQVSFLGIVYTLLTITGVHLAVQGIMAILH